MKRLALTLLLSSLFAPLPGTTFAQVISAELPPVNTQPAAEVISFANNPQLFRLDSFMLRLPFVDYAGIPGLYQDATIEYLPQNDRWRLSGYTQAVPIDDIDAVQVVVTDELPAQVFLDISGKLTNGCLQVGQAGIKQVGAAFTVYLFYQAFRPDCVGTADVRNFRKVVPLDVYGLHAGTYTWTLNGKFSGTFTLAADNVLE